MRSNYNKHTQSIFEIDKKKGFTLTEVIIAVAIVGILATIAIPTYEHHVAKARCSDATTILVKIASQQEQFFLDNKTYTTDLTDLGYDTSTMDTENGYYQVAVEAATDSCGIQTCYSLKATLKNTATSHTSFNSLTLNSMGTKLPTDGCW